MNANFVPFGSLPGGIILALVAAIVVLAVVNFDLSGSDDDNKGGDDVS